MPLSARTRRRPRTTGAAVVAAALLLPSAAGAQATRTWVSGVGDDANPCSRTAPCKTFAGAISKTAVGGEIDALDDGGFGTVTITKSITIDGGPKNSSVLGSGTNGITINAASSRVTLRNLSINGAGTGLAGVRVLEAQTVRIDKSTIFNFTGAGVDNLVSSAGSLHRVTIRDTSIFANGVGIYNRPASGATGRVTVSRADIDDNGEGIVADGTGGKAKVTVTKTGITDSGTTPNATPGLTAGCGIDAKTANAAVRIGSNDITGNINGLCTDGLSTILSFGNNQLFGNDTDGAPTAKIPLV